MSNEQQQLATPFPGPPSFWQSFTAENVERLRALDSAAPDGQPPPASELPEELRDLRPPTPPASGEYSVFGEDRSLKFKVPPIPEGERVLPPPSDPAQRVPTPSPQALLTVTRSILLSYLELLHLLIANPAGTEYGPKWEDLRDLFRSAHTLLNAYRGWQSRETLIGLMEEHVRKGEEARGSWEELETKVEELLKGIAEEGDKEAEALQGGGESGKVKRKAGELRRMWELLEDDMEDS